jgi:hypothetical protein
MYLVASNNQESGIARMENTRMELVPTWTKFMNALSCGQWPHSNRFLTDRCQVISVHIPANRVYRCGVPLEQNKKIIYFNGDQITNMKEQSFIGFLNFQV